MIRTSDIFLFYIRSIILKVTSSHLYVKVGIKVDWMGILRHLVEKRARARVCVRGDGFGIGFSWECLGVYLYFIVRFYNLISKLILRFVLIWTTRS